ncbi:hypothetical protein psal_cds_395 [Pandoravirus salinus]|uniref:Uncharacterized protein n=1 Tax=Pandoravirus salinus TaxID=1349410 RepID=S4VUR3_9VIRU|nr:hypothetical protein psal_cds_395 [Pandoravirus salinus]AGO84088.1 hypothetical protein psal_cds_395 [Pandoravirus salinus]
MTTTMTAATVQHIEIVNGSDSNLYLHLAFYGGGASDTMLAPGARAGTYSGTPTAKRVQCIGLHGQFSGSPYATCVAQDAVMTLTAHSDGIEHS